jgi:glycosyltransferase involved in cell wall biosynthesis
MLTFVGNLAYEPNQDAVRRLAEDIGPAVIAERPDARFVVIGQGDAGVSEHQRPWITFTGYLSRYELVSHLCATDVFLVPVEVGSGIRIKITEAAACGRAIVATREAAVGMEQFGEQELIRAEDAGADFVARVLGLVRDRGLRETVGARAQARAEATFGWESTLESYEGVYRSIGALG